MTSDIKYPTFLLQSGPFMSAEKTACSFSHYPIRYCKYEDVGMLNPDEARLRYVPVGSVEFTEEYCRHVGLGLPVKPSFMDGLEGYCHRQIRRGTFKEALDTEFVKPVKVKEFTANVKGSIQAHVNPDTEVYISEVVPFESEFRFYIHDFVNRFEILGWSRYDDLSVRNPEPDWGIVEAIAQRFHDSLGPNAYSIDIGWRPDKQCYSLVEINDGWSLGFYENSDRQSGPPTRQQYADMLVSRWSQILFCNIA